MTSTQQSEVHQKSKYSKESKSGCPTFQIRQYFNALPETPDTPNIREFLSENLTPELKKKYCASNESCRDTFLINLFNEQGEKVAKARVDILLIAAMFEMSNCVRCALVQWREVEYPLRRYVADHKELTEMDAVWKRDWAPIIEKFSSVIDSKHYEHIFSSAKVQILKVGNYEGNGQPLEHFTQESSTVNTWDDFLSSGAVRGVRFHVERDVPLCLDTNSANLASNILHQLVERFDKFQSDHKDLLGAIFCFTPFVDLFTSVTDTMDSRGCRKLIFYDWKHKPRFLVKQIKTAPSDVSKRVNKAFGANEILQPLLDVLTCYQSEVRTEKLCICVTDLNFFTMALLLPPEQKGESCTMFIDAFSRPLRDEDSMRQLMGWIRFAQNDRTWRKNEQWEKGFCMNLSEAQRDVNWRGKIC